MNAGKCTASKFQRKTREAAMRPYGATHEKCVKITWDMQLS